MLARAESAAVTAEEGRSALQHELVNARAEIGRLAERAAAAEAALEASEDRLSATAALLRKERLGHEAALKEADEKESTQIDR